MPKTLAADHSPAHVPIFLSVELYYMEVVEDKQYIPKVLLCKIKIDTSCLSCSLASLGHSQPHCVVDQQWADSLTGFWDFFLTYRH